MFGVEHSTGMMRSRKTKKTGNISTTTTVSNNGSKLGKRSSNLLAAVHEAPSKDESS